MEVETISGVQATVGVLPSWRERSVLQIELSQFNLDLLLEEPRAEPTPFTPNIEQPDVVWVKDRNHVRCTYWDSRKKQWKIKSQALEFDPDMDDDQKQEIANREAEALQRFYNDNHNSLGNLPSCDESADSAPVGPEVKRGRSA
mgnify:CR=1 FL=1